MWLADLSRSKRRLLTGPKTDLGKLSKQRVQVRSHGVERDSGGPGTTATETALRSYRRVDDRRMGPLRQPDPFPRSVNDLEHGSSSPNDQQRLVAGMLDPDNLLDIIRTFTLFSRPTTKARLSRWLAATSNFVP
jgi:hypothetical protein